MRIKNSAMADQFQQKVPHLVEKVEASKSRTFQQSKYHNKSTNNRRSVMSHDHGQMRNSGGSHNSKVTQQDAAFAIAANLAESRIRQLLKMQETEEYHTFIRALIEDNLLKTISKLRANEKTAYENRGKDNQVVLTVPENEQILSEKPQLLTLREKLKHLWQVIMSYMPKARRAYYTEWERVQIMIELILTINRLRNYFSHMSRLKKKEAFNLTGKASFTAFLGKLYDEAQTHAQTRGIIKVNGVSQVIKIVGTTLSDPEKSTKYHLHQEFGSIFVLNLFLAKSQAERLMQQIEKFKAHGTLPPVSRHLKKLFCMYCQRDGYSETQLDPNSALTREMIGYLNLPPEPSQEGQTQLERWKELKVTDPDSTQTPQFRRESKLRYYIHQTIDQLNMLPELKFLGVTQTRTSLQQDDDTSEYTPWVNDTILIGKDNLVHQKDIREQSYGRNLNLGEYNRFVYDMSDGNLRFELTWGGETLKGVLRLRDWVNWVFITLTEPQHTPKLLQYVFDWLKKYQTSLSTDKLDASLKRHYPKQLQAKIDGAPDNLRTRIWTRLQARKRRNVQCSQRLKAEQMPIHEQIHEILHEFIRGLNAKGRGKISRNVYVHLQKLLLQYKGVAIVEEIMCLKSDSQSHVDAPSGLSNKRQFWSYLYHYSPQEWVTDNKTHPIWESRITQGKKGEKGVVSLSTLCRLQLKRQFEDIVNAEEFVKQANEQELKNLAHIWQVSLQQNETDDPSLAQKSGSTAAIHHALKYSVLPSGWVQQALTWQQSRSCIGQTKEQVQTKLGINMASKIREYSTKMRLRIEYYDINLRYPHIVKSLKNTGDLGRLLLSVDDKKAWKNSVKMLNDWHTDDKLCLIMAERLAEQAKIELQKDKTVGEFSDQQPTIPLTAQNVQGSSSTVELRLTRATQATRGWLVWSKAKLAQAACWHYDKSVDGKNAEIDAQNVVQLINNYQNHYLSLAQAFLDFEYRFYQSFMGKQLIQNPNYLKKGYVDFESLLKEVRKTYSMSDDDAKALKFLRNSVMHDGLLKLKGPIKNLLLNSSQKTFDISQLGEPQLKILKNMCLRLRK